MSDAAKARALVARLKRTVSEEDKKRILVDEAARMVEAHRTVLERQTEELGLPLCDVIWVLYPDGIPYAETRAEPLVDFIEELRGLGMVPGNEFDEILRRRAALPPRGVVFFCLPTTTGPSAVGVVHVVNVLSKHLETMH
jgi:hypothetical protein